MFSWLLWLALIAVPCFAQNFTRGQKWQIILLGTPDMSKMPLPPTDAEVWDIDLFDNDPSTITRLKAAGKTVICYFSAGTREDWRDDAKDFPAADQGKVLPEWPNEKWIRTGSTKIREIMAKRIKLAGDRGCDAIDPDNIVLYTNKSQQNDNGLNLKNNDAINYMQWMQKEAARYNMKVGLKNSIDILDTLAPIMDFAVNEQCASLTECERYNNFLASGKPVFHVEYPNPLNPAAAKTDLCTGPGTSLMSNILKNLALDGPTVYCDGSQVDTPTKGGTSPPRPTPSKSSTTRASSTIRSTTSSKIPSSSNPPTTTSKPISSSTTIQRPPTSTPGNGGCRQKHWDQCGGNDWKGCKTCESPYQCKGVSPPYYYQCL
ncbi:carbohydrate-binding module family 1 protein [Lentithecium fluviatile CBS 122367]|uniref:alpha-galactosidase n=1 Tax=Lentithecium fluviatile CBS 122367 TaxID=1168545 RepID=A0A6G1IXY2_9PLEO|nr:carbohydrate-binding module family 1 protein [Lentithecium fluviatile CBS 122367]